MRIDLSSVLAATLDAPTPLALAPERTAAAVPESSTFIFVGRDAVRWRARLERAAV